jgi:hypothetical protein
MATEVVAEHRGAGLSREVLKALRKTSAADGLDQK